MNNSEIYRLDIRYPANRGGSGTKFRLVLTADKGHEGIETVGTAHSDTKPSMAQIKTWLARKGFEAYGDLAILSGGVIRTMAKKIS